MDSGHTRPRGLRGALTHSAGVTAVLHRAGRLVGCERRASLESVTEACVRAGADLGLPEDVTRRAIALVRAVVRVRRRQTLYRLFPRRAADARAVLAAAIANAEAAIAARDDLARVAAWRASRRHMGVIIDRRI